MSFYKSYEKLFVKQNEQTNKKTSQQLDIVSAKQAKKNNYGSLSIFTVGAYSVSLLGKTAEALRQQQHELTEADRVT